MAFFCTFIALTVIAAFSWPKRTKKDDRPTCYSDYPFLHGQEAAERDCPHCSHAYGCHEDSPDPRTKA